MKRIDLTNVQEAGEFERPAAGAYVCKIIKAEDFPEKEYLKVTYDIAEGKFAGYYEDMRANHSDWLWAGAYTKSYKPKAQGMFKRFCSAVSRSNGNFVFNADKINADERTLAGKKIGLVFQEEEYYGNDGEKKTRLIVNRECPVDAVAGAKIPAVKKLPDEPDTSGVDGFMAIPDGIDEEMPFA